MESTKAYCIAILCLFVPISLVGFYEEPIYNEIGENMKKVELGLIGENTEEYISNVDDTFFPKIGSFVDDTYYLCTKTSTDLYTTIKSTTDFQNWSTVATLTSSVTTDLYPTIYGYEDYLYIGYYSDTTVITLAKYGPSATPTLTECCTVTASLASLSYFDYVIDIFGIDSSIYFTGHNDGFAASPGTFIYDEDGVEVDSIADVYATSGYGIVINDIYYFGRGTPGPSTYHFYTFNGTSITETASIASSTLYSGTKMIIPLQNDIYRAYVGQAMIPSGYHLSVQKVDLNDNTITQETQEERLFSIVREETNDSDSIYFIDDYYIKKYIDQNIYYLTHFLSTFSPKFILGTNVILEYDSTDYWYELTYETYEPNGIQITEQYLNPARSQIIDAVQPERWLFLTDDDENLIFQGFSERGRDYNGYDYKIEYDSLSKQELMDEVSYDFSAGKTIYEIMFEILGDCEILKIGTLATTTATFTPIFTNMPRNKIFQYCDKAENKITTIEPDGTVNWTAGISESATLTSEDPESSIRISEIRPGIYTAIGGIVNGNRTATQVVNDANGYYYTTFATFITDETELATYLAKIVAAESQTSLHYKFKAYAPSNLYNIGSIINVTDTKFSEITELDLFIMGRTIYPLLDFTIEYICYDKIQYPKDSKESLQEERTVVLEQNVENIDATTVKNTGNETIAGVKTFSNYFLTPNKPIISGRMGTISSINGAQVVKFDEFFVSQGITYNSSTGGFTVPIAGIYRITFNPFFATAYSNCRVGILKNTTTWSASTNLGHAYRESSTYDTGGIHVIVSLAANDVLYFYLAAGSLYNTTNDRFNTFSIELIG